MWAADPLSRLLLHRVRRAAQATADSPIAPVETESPQPRLALTSVRPSAFLVAGVLLVVLAQYVFITTDATDRSPPLAGAGALLAGILVFATGSYLYHARQPERAASLSHTPADIPLAVPSRPLLVWGVGTLLASLLIVRLLTGSQSPWDLLPWVLALGAFALPFFPNLRLPEWRGAMQAFQRIRYDALIVAGFVVFFIAINARDLNAWYYSIIGDEYVFWENARIILDNGLLRSFDQAGVHQEHPVLNVAFKSFVMLFAGQNHFGITFSSVLAGAASIPGVYLLAHAVGRGRTTAIIATALFSFSHYIFAFVHIQYISVDGMIPAVYAFGFLVLASGNAARSSCISRESRRGLASTRSSLPERSCPSSCCSCFSLRALTRQCSTPGLSSSGSSQPHCLPSS